MNVKDYNKNPLVNTELIPVTQNQMFHTNESAIEFVELGKPPKFNLLSSIRKLSNEFLKGLCFKIIFGLADKLDTSRKSSPFDLDKLVEVIFNYSNIKYASFLILAKILFKLFRLILYKFKLHNLVEYKRLNFLYGLIVNIILIPLGKKSSLAFYTCIFYLIKNLLFFSRNHIHGLDKRLYNQSKELYYIGLSLGFILITLIMPEYRNKIKLLKYFLE